MSVIWQGNVRTNDATAASRESLQSFELVGFYGRLLLNSNMAVNF